MSQFFPSTLGIHEDSFCVHLPLLYVFPDSKQCHVSVSTYILTSGGVQFISAGIGTTPVEQIIQVLAWFLNSFIPMHNGQSYFFSYFGLDSISILFKSLTTE